MKKLLIIPLLLLTLTLAGQQLIINGSSPQRARAAAGGGNVAPSFLSSDGDTWGWYVTAYSTSVTQDGSHLVSEHADTLGSGHDLAQATGTKQPTWSADGITFDGASNGDFLTTGEITLSQPVTIYAVIKQIAWEDYDRMIDGYLGTAILQQITASPQIRVYAGSASSTSSDLHVGDWGIVTIIFNGANSLLQVNGEAAITGNFGAGNPTGISLGGAATAGTNYNSNFIYKEIIVREVDDDATERSSVISYLNSRYSVY